MPTDPRGLRSDAPLFDAWLSFHKRTTHAFTIPGHKHRLDLVGDVIASDVPYYAGLDTMKLAHGVLADAQKRAARLWEADRCWFSAGGSTHGNQALALAVARPGARVVITRSAHRSLVTALVLAGLEPVWVIPDVDPATGLPLPITAEQLERACKQAQSPSAPLPDDDAQTSSGSGPRPPVLADPQLAAFFLTDPAYVGTHGDVAAWAEVAHAHGAPLIVDAAWAAHFGFHPDLPDHALACGADALVTSAHKVLPAYSQAALILLRSNRIDQGRLETAIDATHTTSPAGSIYASIDASRALLARDGEQLLGDCLGRVRRLRDRFASVPGLVVLDGPGIDPLKITLVLAGTGADGIVIEQDLIAAGQPVELADRDTIVAMVTMADEDADLETLADNLIESIERHRAEPRQPAGMAAYTITPEVVMSPRGAYYADHAPTPIEFAVGHICSELIAPYPPGIPVLAPGERITEHGLDALLAARDAGARIAYAADPTLRTILTVVAPVPC